MKTLQNTLEKLKRDNPSILSMEIEGGTSILAVRFEISPNVTNIDDYHKLVNLIYSRILMCGWQTAFGMDIMRMDTDGIKQIMVTPMESEKKEYLLTIGIPGIDPINRAGIRDRRVGRALIYITSYID